MRRRLSLPVLCLIFATTLLGCPKRVGSQNPGGGEIDPAIQARLEEAKKKAEAGQTEEAQKIISEVGKLDSPELADALFTLAESQFSARDYGNARDNYRQLLSRFPLFVKGDIAKSHLGLAQLELKEYRDALETLSPLYGRVTEEEKAAAAARLARAADGAKSWGEAVRWHSESLATARDEKTQKEEQQRILDLLEGQVPFIDVAKLAADTAPTSPIWPMVQFKLARIYAHLRDYANLKETLNALLAKAPASPFTKDAQAMLARAERRAEVKPNVIGVVLPLSGKYRTVGENVLAGITLGAGDKVKIVTRDSGGDAAQARKAVTELALDEQVIGIIGPVSLGESEDAASEAELQETPIFTLTRSEGITERGSFVFRNMITYSAQAKALVDYAMRVKGFKKFGVVYPNIPYGTELANFFWDEVEARDGQVFAAETYDNDQTTFSSLAKKLVGRYYLEDRDDFRNRRREILDTIKDPYRQRKAFEDLKKHLEPSLDFEALFVPDSYKNVGLITPALAVEDIITNACDKRDIEKIAKTAGKEPRDIKTVQLLGSNGWNDERLVERGGKFVQCAVFVDGFFGGSDRKDTRTFVADFKKANPGKEPSLWEAAGYDTARILRSVIETEKPATRAALRDGLLRVKDFPGATGRTTISPKREAEKPLFLLTIDRGQIREIDSDTKS